MASNPMQRKSRNSFLLGIIVTLLITGVIIAILFLQLKQKNDELNAELAAKKTVYTLTQNVKAGQILTEDMFAPKKIHKDSIPSNAPTVANEIETWFLQTKEGESVYTDEIAPNKYALYLDRTSGEKASDTIVEVITNESKTFKDVNGNTIDIGDMYIVSQGIIEKISSKENLQTDEEGIFFIDTQGNDKITRVYQEDETDEFYIYKIDTTTMNMGGTTTRIKEYIDIKNVPVLARVDMNANTVITSKLVVQSDEQVTDDTRQEEYNMITLPVDLMTNDYVDIRLRTPGGQNFIVVSKAQVDIPMNADGTYVVDTMRVNLREDEILAMSSAIVEAYGLSGSELYVTKYVDPAMQEASLPTYTPNAAVTAQIQSNPNVVEIAREELAARYSEAAKNARNQYLQGLINNTEGDEYLGNIQDGVEESIKNSIKVRQEYLERLEDEAQN